MSTLACTRFPDSLSIQLELETNSQALERSSSLERQNAPGPCDKHRVKMDLLEQEKSTIRIQYHRGLYSKMYDVTTISYRAK